ncbi:MAG: hypothetical protein KME05_08015 [Gloeocapsa sp. UFS-A4-WI-NPMV-4B04]|jgi:hypothetical protein|nr:hypothetical protein [Gloeocapsa sp. UFS-A4-WI-NPMV-4B04]
MLAYVLALAVGLGSLAIYLAAFFFPEVHRKNDFIWSGLGLFYALVLWVCAGRITGSLLLGQVTSVALLGWSVGQTLSLRRQMAPSTQTPLPTATEVKNTVGEKVSNSSLFGKISQIGKRVGGSATAAKDRLQENLSGTNQTPTSSTAASDASVSNDNSKVQIIDKRTPIAEQPADISATQQLTSGTQATTDTEQVISANPPQPDELVQTARESDVVEDTQVEVAPVITEELVAETDVEIAPLLTEEEAIALAVEMTLAEDAEQEDREQVVEPIRPHPPDPEIVEAAILDAEEKHIEASPPEPEIPENPSPS